MGNFNPMGYTIDDHKHRFAAWAASRAASVNGCRFKVEQGKTILETVGIQNLIPNPDNLPLPQDFDDTHRKWRENVILAAKDENLNFTHGVAAKLINIYLKSIFVCAGKHAHVRVKAIHPPIDSLLLDRLSEENVGGFKKFWNESRHIRWSKFNSEQYETVIRNIKASVGDEASLWEIEKYWKGYR